LARDTCTSSAFEVLTGKSLRFQTAAGRKGNTLGDFHLQLAQVQSSRLTGVFIPFLLDSASKDSNFHSEDSTAWHALKSSSNESFSFTTSTNLYGACEVLAGKAVGTRLCPYGIAWVL